MNSDKQILILKTRKLKDYIEGLSGFTIVPPEIPYGHMGATICDAVLQSGLKWESVVKPRLEKLQSHYPEAATTSGFLKLIKEVGIKKILNWRDEEKPTRICKLTELFLGEGIETEAELNAWLMCDENETKLKQQRGVGNKTADYFKILVGIPAVAIDRHLVNFLDSASIEAKDYGEAREIIHGAADLMGLNRTVLDHSIWKFMSQRKSSNLCRSTGKNIKKAHESRIVPHTGILQMKHSFNDIWDYLDNEGPFHLNTSTGTEFEARAAISGEDEPVIKFFQKGMEYARAYECCWGHYYNCNRTRFGMYAKGLEHFFEALQKRKKGTEGRL